MRDQKLLEELLSAESEAEVLAALDKRGLLSDPGRWRYLGNMPNNQSVVHNQQSTPIAALVEKYTNAADALLLRKCKAAGVDPREKGAPAGMAEAVESYFGDLAANSNDDRRDFGEENLLLYATGSKARPCLSLYDNGEGQLAEDFSKTFCSLIYGSDEGSYKGAINFVQGRFNMGGTGVLPFCSEERKPQLVVSRVPTEVAGGDDHEWAYTLMCFFPSQKDPSWKYLVGDDGVVLTAGREPVHLVPRKGARSGALCKPRERAVESGTLIKMYNFQAPRSNICGELYKKLGLFLIQPALPLRIVECRSDYKANVMANTAWDRLAGLETQLESGSEDEASIAIPLSTGEVVTGAIRVFKPDKKKKKGDPDGDEARAGLFALINGQRHARRGPEFFRTKKVNKEHIAGSMLVTLDCTALGQQSRNRLFMPNREHFRDDPLLDELLKELRDELRTHEWLDWLDKERYKQKVEAAADDELGIKAMEELLSDSDLAGLFGGFIKGSAGTDTATDAGRGGDVDRPEPFKGQHFPSYFRRKDGATEVDVEIARGGVTRVSFVTDVRNNYFSRSKNKGTCSFAGDLAPAYRLFNGRLTFTCRAPKAAGVGTELVTAATITDPKGSGPFQLVVNAKVVRPVTKKKRPTTDTKPPKGKSGPSRPEILEVDHDLTDPPITVERDPERDVLQILFNRKAASFTEAKLRRPAEEEPAVHFVFKYGLAFLAMAMIEDALGTDDWKEDEPDVRSRIGQRASALAKVIVPLCLDLPKKLPKAS